MHKPAQILYPTILNKKKCFKDKFDGNLQLIVIIFRKLDFRDIALPHMKKTEPYIILFLNIILFFGKKKK